MRTGVSPKRIDTRKMYLLRKSMEKPSVFGSALANQQQYNLYFFFLRKEVIQPHLPIRLPCYDFTPVTGPAFGSSFPLLSTTRDVLSRLVTYSFIEYNRTSFCYHDFTSCSLGVRSLTSGITNSHGVTGGVYKTRERIHRDILIRDY